jgi:hypothetical protein
MIFTYLSAKKHTIDYVLLIRKLPFAINILQFSKQKVETIINCQEIFLILFKCQVFLLKR